MGGCKDFLVQLCDYKMAFENNVLENFFRAFS